MWFCDLKKNKGNDPLGNVQKYLSKMDKSRRRKNDVYVEWGTDEEGTDGLLIIVFKDRSCGYCWRLFSASDSDSEFASAPYWLT